MVTMGLNQEANMCALGLPNLHSKREAPMQYSFSKNILQELNHVGLKSQIKAK